MNPHELIDPKWNPTSLKEFERYIEPFINNTSNLEQSYELTKNLSYALQYIQYLLYILRPETHYVIQKQLIKSIVIHGTALIEAILYCILLSNNKISKDNWTLVEDNISTKKVKIDEDTEIKIVISVYKKTKEINIKEITLNSMIRKVENNYLLGEDHELYKKLNFLRKLRNKVHIHIFEKKLDTDSNNFNKDELKTLKQTLFMLLASDKVNFENNSICIFEFLK